MNGSGTLNRSRLPPKPPEGHMHDDPSHNAALKGASLAFQKSNPTTPKQVPTTVPSRNIGNGALIAATSAASASASRDQSRNVSRQTTGDGGGSSHDIEHGALTQRLSQHLKPPGQSGYGTPSYLGPGSKQTMADPRSPSFIAATLAASRSVSPIRQQMAHSNQYAQKSATRRRKHSVSGNNSAASSVTSLDLATDTTSIPSTNTLISMFEKRQDDDTDPVKKSIETPDNRKSLGAKPKPKPRALSPVVKNEASPPRLASSMAWERTSPTRSKGEIVQEKPRQLHNEAVDSKRRPPTPPPTRTKTVINTSAPPEALESRGKPRASTPPPKSISRANTVVLSPQPRRSTPQKILLNDVQAQDSIAAKDQEFQPTKPKPRYSSSVHNTPKSSQGGDGKARSSTSSDDTFVSASSGPVSAADSPVRGRSRLASPDTLRPERPKQSRPHSAHSVATISAAHPPPLPRRHPHPHPHPHQQPSSSSLTLDSLTDAIMAGSLASSRLTPSATQTPPPVPPSRKQTPHMRQTLRQPPSKSDDEDGDRARSRHRRKPLGKLGGNKHTHHEGARKRWREEITARERKRYEGVWASNRGLLLVEGDGSGNGSPSSGAQGQAGPPIQSAPQAPRSHQYSHRHRHHHHQNLANPPTSKPEPEPEPEKADAVANVVVRDLWARSRLPFDELAEVWDLVDRRGRGYLDRTEFVVGMWLVDQRLRGRKIPHKVGESVWGSAMGVRVGSLKGGKGKGRKK
ncbi:hypothetical protein F4819DRAFT_504813 [Hypoxylon fuscum]|nr:hypothetical protein F4819DRAFT_504813 [Hypoxylon fuscum]